MAPKVDSDPTVVERKKAHEIVAVAERKAREIEEEARKKAAAIEKEAREKADMIIKEAQNQSNATSMTPQQEETPAQSKARVSQYESATLPPPPGMLPAGSSSSSAKPATSPPSSSQQTRPVSPLLTKEPLLASSPVDRLPRILPALFQTNLIYNRAEYANRTRADENDDPRPKEAACCARLSCFALQSAGICILAHCSVHLNAIENYRDP